MATTLLLKLTTILSLTIPLLLALSFQSQTAFSTATEDHKEYVLDALFANTRLRSRFLDSIKKGAHCNSHTKNICNGVSANHGTSLLYCCKTRCRNVLGDRNNCGKCGHKCGLGQLCCGGTCTNVAYDPAHCGKCHKICSPGLECEYGSCGYA